MVEIGDGVDQIAAVEIGVGAAVIGDLVARIELDGGGEIGDGRGKVALGAVGEAAVVERGGVARVELESVVEVGDGLVVVALGAVGDAAVVIGAHVVRVELDRLVEVADGAVVLALGQQSDSHFLRKVSGIEFTALLNVFQGFQITGNATLSQNKIEDGKQYLSSVDYLDSSGNRISGFPDFLSILGISYNYNGIFLQLTGKYAGAFFSDNYDNNISEYLNQFPGFISYTDNKNEAYFTADFTASYQFKPIDALNSSKIFVQVNNIFDKLYSANAIGPEFFPAAERNFIAGVQVGL